MNRTAVLLLVLLAAAALCAAVLLYAPGGKELGTPLDTPVKSASPAEQDDLAETRAPSAPPPAGLSGTAAQPPSESAWRLTGQVVSARGDRPVPFPQVQAWWIEGPRTQLLAQGPGDEHGRFLLALPALEAMSDVRRLRGLVEVRATAAGFGPRPGVKERDVPPDVRLPAKERELRCTVRLAAGRTLSGRLVTHGMEWPRQARVRVVPEDRGRAWKTLAQTCVGPDARFTVLVPTDDAIVLEIHAPGFGRLRHGPYAPNVADAGDILLITPTTIEGQVVDESGRPRAGAWIAARRPVDSPPPVGWSRISCGSGRWSEEVAHVQADDRGRFVVPSGRAGSTWKLAVVPHSPPRGIANMLLDDVVLARLDHEAPKLVPAMESIQARSGDRDVRLVSVGTSVRVLVTDVEGVALPGAEVVLLGWAAKPSAGATRPEGPPAERLIVETDEHGHAWTQVHTPSLWYLEAETAPATARRTLPTRNRSQRRPVGVAPLRAESWLAVPEGPTEVQETLVMPPSPGDATLDVRVASESGESLPPIQLQVFTRGGRRLFVGKIPHRTSLQLPAGACRVHVSSGTPVHPSAPFTLSPLPPGGTPRASYMTHVEDLELEARRTTTLDVTLEVLAELRIEAELSAASAGPDGLGSVEVGVAYVDDAAEPRMVPLPLRTGTWIARVRPGRARVFVRRTREGESPPTGQSATAVHDVVFASGQVCRLPIRDE